MRRFLYITLLICTLTACTTNNGGSVSEVPEGGDTVTSHSQLLRLTDHEGWTLAELRNPWDTAAAPLRYALATDIANDIPDGLTVIRVPVKRTVATSSIHMAAIVELGAFDALAAVTDAEYINIKSVKDAVASGRIADAGTATSPTLETILELSPDLVLATPYADSDHSALTKMKIPVIEMADYMEQTPAGRAEWIKLVGRLYGHAAKADSIYDASMAEYARLSKLAATSERHPKVITEQLTSGTWYVPGGASYMARLLSDSGAEYPFADNTSAGSLALDFATVFDRAGDADFWILKSYGKTLTLADLKADHELNAHMKAWQTGGVYAANTAECAMYEEFPFHPERLLADYMLIFHPELADSLPAARYFHKVKP